MCKHKVKEVRRNLLNAANTALYMRGVGNFFDGDLQDYVSNNIIRDELQRALRERMGKEHLIAHYFTNTDYNLWE